MNRDTDGQTEREACRHADIETDRHADRLTDRKRDGASLQGGRTGHTCRQTSRQELRQAETRKDRWTQTEQWTNREQERQAAIY